MWLVAVQVVLPPGELILLRTFTDGGATVATFQPFVPGRKAIRAALGTALFVQHLERGIHILSYHFIVFLREIQGDLTLKQLKAIINSFCVLFYIYRITYVYQCVYFYVALIHVILQ